MWCVEHLLTQYTDACFPSCRLLFNDDQERYDALSVLCAANDIVFGPEDTKTLLRYVRLL